MDAQETGNAIGAKLREAEANANAEGATQTTASLADLHGLLAQAAVDFHPELDWDQLAGNNDEATKNARPDGGGKTPPTPTGN